MIDGMNSQLSQADVKASFDKERKVRVKSFLTQDHAEQLLLSLTNEVPFEMALVRGGRYESISQSAWKAMDNQAKQAVNTEVMSNAAKGIGFVYGRHLVTSTERIAQMSKFYDWINSEAVLQWARDLSGFDDICTASVQATRYTPGQFLTRHQDVVEREQRRLAYVINLAPQWHPDWGGLLQFYEEDGTTTESWAPEFNTLSLFDVKHIHSVSYVTPFAQQPRYALTGWFKAT
ncbi:MAG: 2OG-Fe(II) oxygenase family protein [Pseudomonadota bacterium]|jgi:Rps23 Pro-64 3,4-dihydroxylase Tpa1-like proline 4-hydroxylase|uniref:2OG-Fe(II) oxygenase n=1 Tax=unclassified Alteromonas TaxID=2614992 RepID=UPI002EC4BB00|nr:2OG-Fe(II) oxygenase family protein [Pseudomonadota bacterium]